MTISIYILKWSLAIYLRINLYFRSEKRRLSFIYLIQNIHLKTPSFISSSCFIAFSK